MRQKKNHRPHPLDRVTYHRKMLPDVRVKVYLSRDSVSSPELLCANYTLPGANNDLPVYKKIMRSKNTKYPYSTRQKRNCNSTYGSISDGNSRDDPILRTMYTMDKKVWKRRPVIHFVIAARRENPTPS